MVVVHLRVTKGYLGASEGHLRVTIGYLKAIVLHIRVTLGHLKDGKGHFMVTIGHFRITIAICHSFFLYFSFFQQTYGKHN